MLDGGSVITTLGYDLEPGKAKAYEDQVKKTAVAAEAAEGRMAAAAGRTAAAQERSASSAEKAAKSNGRLRESLPLRAMDDYGKSSTKAEQNLTKLGSVGAKGAAVGVLSLAAATIYAAKTAGDFEKQMRNVNSIAKLNEDGYHKLSRSVLGLAGETAQAPKVLAEGLYQLVSSGFDASDSLIILKASAKAATAGLTDTQTATTAVAAVLNAYRLPATQASAVSDTLFETVNRGVLSFAELSKEIGTVLPFAASLGVNLNEVGAAVSTMTKEGISAPETMTRIKQAMVSIIKPSKDMKEAIKETGASSGQALVQQKGFQGAIEALVKTTGGSKEALAGLFPNIRALGGVLALTGKNTRGANGDLKAFQDTAGATSKVFNEQAKGAEFAGKRLSASFQTAAIIFGNQVLPILAKGAGELTQTLQKAASDGSLERLGHSVIALFEEIGQVGADLAPPIEAVAGALVDVGHAIGLGNAHEVAALAAGFLAFKGVTFVAPMLIAVAGAMSEVGVAAATAPTIAAFFADMAAAGLLIPGIGLAVAGIAGAFLLLSSGMSGSTSAAQANANAMQADKSAIEGVNDAVNEAATAHFAAQRAALARTAAEKHLAAVNKEIADGTLKGKAADEAKKEATLGLAEAVNQQTVANQHAAEAVKTKATEEGKALEKIEKGRKATEDAIKAEERVGSKRKGIRTDAEQQARQEKLLELRAKELHYLEQEAQKKAELQVADESLRRIEAGGGRTAITSQNAQDVAELQNALRSAGASQKVTAKYELDDQGAQAQLGKLSLTLTRLGQGVTVAKVLTTAPNAAVAVLALQAVLRGVPGSKVIRIIHNAGSAKLAMFALKAATLGVPAQKVIAIESNANSQAQKVAELKGLIDGLTDKTVTITTAFRQTGKAVGKAISGFASGRGMGGREAAVVGEGRGSEYVVDGQTGHGVKVDGPTLMGLAPQDYVVPLEEKYRGRALGLFAALAKDLDIPGYAAGKKGKKAPAKHRPIPGKLDPLSIPVDEVEQRYSTAQSEYHKDTKRRASIEKQIRTAERSLRFASPKSKPKAQAKLNELQNELAKVDPRAHKQKMDLLKSEVAQAKAFASKVAHEESLINQAANDMKLADGRNDEKGYQSAKGRRGSALKKLEELIAQQKGHAHGKFLDELNEHLGQREVESQEASGESFSEQALSPEDLAKQKGLEEKVALAALTPGLADDTTAAQNLVGFFESALGSAQARGAGAEAITELANDVKTARSNLESLSGNGSNENSDLQAQINQANERAEVAQRAADIANQALQVFGGPGDIGAGGSNARNAAANITINTLHPGDPATLSAIGAAATAGIGLQGSRQSVRQQVGP